MRARKFNQQVVSRVCLVADRTYLGFAVGVFAARRASTRRAVRVAGAAIAASNGAIAHHRVLSQGGQFDAADAVTATATAAAVATATLTGSATATAAAAAAASAVDHSLALRRVSPPLAGQRIEKFLRNAATRRRRRRQLGRCGVASRLLRVTAARCDFAHEDADDNAGVPDGGDAGCEVWKREGAPEQGAAGAQSKADGAEEH